MFREEHSYYVKELRHYKDLSLDDYRQMVSLRIDGLVVKNQRCINPIDEFDKDAYFCNIWNLKDEYLAASFNASRSLFTNSSSPGLCTLITKSPPPILNLWT